MRDMMTLTCYFREHMLDKGSEGANIDDCVVEATKCIISCSSNSPVGKLCSMTMVTNVKFVTSKTLSMQCLKRLS
jgi:hypothetical protein